MSRVPSSSGLYKIIESENKELVYVGESKNLQNRLRNQLIRFSPNRKFLFSYYQLSQEILDYQRKELENDLIGAFYESFKHAPKRQFSAS